MTPPQALEYVELDHYEKLQFFLYLLMRDELPTGKVATILQAIEKGEDLEPVYTNKGLAACAEEYAERILK